MGIPFKCIIIQILYYYALHLIIKFGVLIIISDQSDHLDIHAVVIVNSLQKATASLQIVLSSQLPEGQRVCPGDQIVFTCMTNGSASLAWSSDDYIGRGGIQLEFASFHDPGRIARNQGSPIGTQATLISKEIEENETKGILESQLNIIVTSDYQIATINCLHVDTGSQESTVFQLLGIISII